MRKQRSGRFPVAMGREFSTPSGLWGWMDRNQRGHDSVELSKHSQVALARENQSRLVTDEIKRYYA